MSKSNKLSPRAKTASTSKDKELNKYAKTLESQHTTTTRPQHKHERYDRIEDKESYDENYSSIFGARTPEDVSKRSGKTTIKYGE